MERYRPNVCVVLTDATGARVLVFRRIDSPEGEPRWQFPQGGLQPNESAEQGALRELREEIGTSAVAWVRTAPVLVRYRFPEAVLQQLQSAERDKGRYVGQAQHWLLGTLQTPVDDLRFDHQPPEFDGWQWVTPLEALRRIVPFKRDAYAEGLQALGLLSSDAVARG